MFKKYEVDEVVFSKNQENKKVRLYITSNPNTYYRSNAIASEETEYSNILVYLWAASKPCDKKEILSVVGENFDRVLFVELPVSNQRVNYFKIKSIDQIYTNLLQHIKPDNILCYSFEFHYCILLDIAKKKKIKIIIAEEGTGSYRYLIKDPNVVIPQITFKHHAINIYKKFWANTVFGKCILKPIGYFFYGIYEYIRSCIQTVDYILNIESFHYNFVKNNDDYKVFLKAWNYADEIRLDYPDVLKQYFNTDNVFYNKIAENLDYDDDVKQAILKNNIDDNTIIFASQMVWGMKSQNVFPYILSILDKASKEFGKKILIKAHPREDMSALISSVAMYDNISLLEDCSFPFERILKFSNPFAVYSISSSSLVYGKTYNQNPEYVSICRDLEHILNKNNLLKGTTKRFMEESDLTMKIFPHIKFSHYFHKIMGHNLQKQKS